MRFIAFPLAYYIARFRIATLEDLFLYCRHAAAVVKLPGARLCLEIDPGEGGHCFLVFQSVRTCKLHPGLDFVHSEHRRVVAFAIAHGHVHCVLLYLAAVYDRPDPDGPGARAEVA